MLLRKTIFIGPRRTGTSSLFTAFARAGLIKDIYHKEHLSYNTPAYDVKSYIERSSEEYLFEPSIFGRDDIVAWLASRDYRIIIISRDAVERFNSDVKYHIKKGINTKLVRSFAEMQNPSDKIIASYQDQFENITILDFSYLNDVIYLKEKIGVKLDKVEQENRALTYPLIIQLLRPIFNVLPRPLRMKIKRLYEKYTC